jgi:hypothetical protein
MYLAIVADPSLRERMRCIRIIAEQTHLSALGAATWQELEQVLAETVGVGLVFYAHPLDGAPEDAIEQLLARSKRVILSADDDYRQLPDTAGLTRTSRPISDETLVVMARMLAPPTAPPEMSFVPVDFLQMICMSGGSHVLVLSQDTGDTGVIEVCAGEVWTAFDSLGVGEDAFARLIRPEMRARVSSVTGSVKERTIWKGLHELVLESMQRIDEGVVLLPPPLSPSQLELTLSSPQRLGERIAELTTDARRLMMQRNYDDAARALIALSELDPNSMLVRANLEQLRRLGYPK